MHRIGVKPQIESQLRRRRIARRVLACLVVVLILSIFLDHFGAFGYAGDDWQRFDHKSCRVLRVIDGDTVFVRSEDANVEAKVRLLGIDAPELHPGTNQPADYWAHRALAYATARMKGKLVTVRLEPTQTRDRHGRLLAYLYLTESDNLNLDLVRDGQAYADRRFRHSFRTQFDQAENDARKKKRGLWEGVTEEQMPAWRREWVRNLPQRRGMPGLQSTSD